MSNQSLVLPDGWEWTRLGHYIQRPQYGYTASATDRPTGVKLLRITDIQDGLVKWQDVPFCECDEDANEKYALNSGDVVVARIGATTGKSYLISDCPRAVFASYLIRIRTKAGLYPEFLNLYFQTPEYWKQINENKGGRLKGGVSIPILENLSLPLPPQSDQQGIVRAARAVQQSRKARQRELTLERERKAALTEYLFTHGIRRERRKQTEIGMMPESWRVIRLQDVCESSIFGPRFSASLYDRSGNIAVIRTTDMDSDGNVDFSTVPLARLSVNRFQEHLLKPGDLMITRSGTVGIASVFQNFSKPVVPGAFLIRFRLSDEIEPHFLAYFLNSSTGRARTKQLASGAIQQNLTSTALLTLKLPLPTREEQRQITDAVLNCDRKSASLKHEDRLMEELFRAMLDELMTGRLSTASLLHEP